MPGSFPRFLYTGKALPANGDSPVIFDSTVAFPMASGFAMLGIHRLLISITNDQAGTLQASQSTNRGTTWTRSDADLAVAIAPSNTNQQFDYLVEPYADWKLVWVNGASTQATFIISIAGSDSRNPAS